MRVLIGHQRAYPVERICPTAEDGKRVLREKPVTELYIDYHVDKRSNGNDVLMWAFKHRLYPNKITLVSNRVHLRNEMAKVVASKGYITNDGINYLKKH